MRNVAVAIALIASSVGLAQQALNHDAVTARNVLRPRVLLRAQSQGEGWSASHNPAMGMSKAFEELCPDVRVSINLYVADYTVELNQIQHGVVPQNQMLVANKDGDLISRFNQWGSVKGGVKKACAAILADWAKK
jgi:hypothetical protein